MCSSLDINVMSLELGCDQRDIEWYIVGIEVVSWLV